MTPTTKKRILLAEDDASIRKTTKFRLEHEGYEVVAAEDGAEVLKLADVTIHLVLLDINLPKMDGYEVCRRLKQNQVTAKIPVLIFSASENQLRHLANRCIEVGAVDWLAKPFRTVQLMEKIHHALGEGESAHG